VTLQAFRARALLRYRQAVYLADRPQPLTEYQSDPISFAVRELGVGEETVRWSLCAGYEAHRWDGDIDPLAQVAETLAAGHSAAIESGTGTGKSFWLAVLYLWFLACWDGARVFTFAPKEDQLRLFSWKEVRELWPRFQRRFPTAELTDLRIRMVPGSDAWGAWGYPVSVRAGQAVAVHAAGMHAPHMLLAYEETSDIPGAVIEAGIQTSVAEHNLRVYVGNPDHQHDSLHLVCQRPDVAHFRASALDHPNVVTGRSVVPGAVTAESIERRFAQRAGRLYDSRVRGLSPSESPEALIRYDLLRQAVARHDDPLFRIGPLALGVDAANSESGDRAAIARGEGACCLRVDAFPCPDSNQLGELVRLEMELADIEDIHVGVDVVGVGAGTANALKARGRFVQALNGGARPVPRTANLESQGERNQLVVETEQYRNLRSQTMWRLREDVHQGLIALPDDPELLEEMVAIEWRTIGGKIVIESKDEPLPFSRHHVSLRARLGRSPNKLDAVAMWNWVRQREPVPEPEKALSAWDPQVLAAEADHLRRVHPQQPRDVLGDLLDII
jgi:hypothetical protein